MVILRDEWLEEGRLHCLQMASSFVCACVTFDEPMVVMKGQWRKDSDRFT